MADEVLYDVVDGVATLTLNRPARLNAQTTAMFELAMKYLDTAASDRGVRVVVVTGAGRAFSAGGDLSVMSEPAGDEVAPRPTRVRALRELTRTSQMLYEMPKVTIAAINGACAGGGFSWAMACDLRYAAVSAKFTTAFVNAGLSGDFGLTWFLPRTVGSTRAKELFFFGDVFDAAQAKELGIVNDVFDDDQLLVEVAARTTRLVGKSPRALAGIKANLNEGGNVDLGRHLEFESDRLISLIGSADNREAAAAFLQKRPAKFVD